MKDSSMAVSCSDLSLWPRAMAPTFAWDTYMVWNWCIVYSAMVAFNWLSQIGRVVGISCFRNFTVVHMLGIWVSGKQSKPCNNGFGSLDCSRIWRTSLLVAQFASVLRIWTRYQLVCYIHCLYHITGLSAGQWILSRDCLTLMGIMHFWFAWTSLANFVDFFHAGQGRMS